MSTIVDYTSLRAEIIAWAARSDSTFTARIPIFVSNAEQRIYNGSGQDERDPLWSPPLRSKVLEVSGTINVASTGIGALPTDLLQARKIYVSTQDYGIEFLPPERFEFESENISGSIPYYYTIKGTAIHLAPAVACTLNIDYYKFYAATTADAPTNAAVTEHGDIYLDFCLYESFSFEREAELALAHLARGRARVQGVNKTATVNRYAGSKLTRKVRNPIP